jgi:hypothetical protein
MAIAAGQLPNSMTGHHDNSPDMKTIKKEYVESGEEDKAGNLARPASQKQRCPWILVRKASDEVASSHQYI